jgi:capsular polysaccharide biosynthesis protein
VENTVPKAGTPTYVEYLRILLKRWRLCLLPSAGAALAAVLIILVVPGKYQAETVIATTNVEVSAGHMSLHGLPLKALVEFFRNRESFQQVMKEFNLHKAPYGYDVGTFSRNVVQVDTPRLAETIVIRVTLRSAELARDVANRLAEVGSEKYFGEMQSQYANMLKHLEEEAKAAKKELSDAEVALEKRQADGKVETLRERVKVLLGLLVDWEKLQAEMERDLSSVTERVKSIIPEDSSWENNPVIKDAMARWAAAEADLENFELETKIQTLRKEFDLQLETRILLQRRLVLLRTELASVGECLRSLQDFLKTEPETIKLDRQLATDPVYQQALAKVSGKSLEELLGLKLMESVLNPVHQAVKEKVLETMAEQSKLNGELPAVEQAEREGSATLAELQERLIRGERVLRSLTLKRDLSIEIVKAAVGQNPNQRSSVLLAEARSRQNVLTTDLMAVKQAGKANRELLAKLQEELASEERQLRELSFRRDMAHSAATMAMQSLQENRLLSYATPKLLNIIPAATPTDTVGPSKGRYAALLFAITLALMWTVAVHLEGKSSQGARANDG